MSHFDYHAFLPPSGSGSWVHCAAWVWMNQAYPQEDKEESMQGTAAHWGFAEILFGRDICEGLVAPNGITLTDEMVDGAELFVRVVDLALQRCGLTRAALHVERKVKIHGIHPKNEGTPDCWFYHAATITLYLFDYKYGHKFIEVFNNWQLIDYAAGILQELGVDSTNAAHVTVKFAIVQPRTYHREGVHRTWAIKAVDLYPHFNKLVTSAAACFEPNPKATTGDHCEYCPGRHACQALQLSAYEAAEKSTDSTPLELDGHALGLELRMLERAQRRLKARITGLQETGLAMMTRPPGRKVSFFAVEPGEGRDAWTAPAEQVIATGALFGAKVTKGGLITPKQAEAAGVPPAIVASMSRRNSGALKLVYDDGTEAAKVFSHQPS